MVSELFKGSGCSSIVTNYRDIMLADISSKNLSKLLLHNIIPGARNYIVSTQFGGGMHQGDTGKAHVYARLMLDIARHQKCACLLCSWT